MILRSLARYYELLAEKGVLGSLGWSGIKISWALEIDESGELKCVYPLKSEVQSGKKTVMVPRELELPAVVKRASQIAANFLWDNAKYILGLSDDPRAKMCFEASAELHTKLLEGVDDPFARGIVAFFKSWDPDSARSNTRLADCANDLLKGENVTFLMDGVFPGQSPKLREAWDKHYDSGGEGRKMRCLITGEDAYPEPTHPSIMKVPGSQSSGAALVSFNAEAFWSFDREQNVNAPVSKRAAFAYTSALNYLVAARDADGKLSCSARIGDMTVVYWAEDGEQAYQEVVCDILSGDDEDSVDRDMLGKVINAISSGETVDWNSVPINPGNRFYILGISPNAARLSVRFFLQSTFGDIIRHIKEHYDRLDIVRPEFSKRESMALWKFLRETVNDKANDKTPSPQMSGDVLRAMLTGGRYPATMYQQTQMRIRADKNIKWRRAALIKAYLLRNTDKDEYKEAAQVKLNEETTYQPYVLGRLFSVLENIQERANPGINATIKDKYFTSACATPAVVFPLLINLSEKHMRKLSGGMRVNLSKQVSQLTNMLTDSYPSHHNLSDQGVFQLGYYHQTQKRYETTAKADAPAPVDA